MCSIAGIWRFGHLSCCSPQCTVVRSVEECLWRRHASDREFRERMAGLKPDQHREPQEDSSASKGHEAAEPLPACSTPHASSAPPAKQLHAPGEQRSHPV